MLELFILCGVIGFVFLAISFIFGEFGGGVEHEIGHDLHVEADHDVSHDLSHETETDHDDSGREGPGFFSIRTMSAFVTVFGLSGLMATLLKTSDIASVLIGVAAGSVGAVIVHSVTKLFFRSQASSIITDNDMLNSTGTVLVEVQKEAIGKVRLTVKGSMVEKLATNMDDTIIPVNKKVRVVGFEKNMVIVVNDDQF
jgi:membrane protein implicated in regulation of membrane protease activity